jgi:hypothetical protein
VVRHHCMLGTQVRHDSLGNEQSEHFSFHSAGTSNSKVKIIKTSIQFWYTFSKYIYGLPDLDLFDGDQTIN